MSGLVDPTGRPIQKTRAISDQQLMSVLGDHEARIQALSAQILQLGIMTEFLMNQLGEQIEGWVMDTEEFVEFRNQRWTEIKAEAEKQVRQATSTVAPGVEVNLDE